MDLRRLETMVGQPVLVVVVYARKAFTRNEFEWAQSGVRPRMRCGAVRSVASPRVG